VARCKSLSESEIIMRGLLIYHAPTSLYPGSPLGRPRARRRGTAARGERPAVDGLGG
jgi:hypothetical protein